MLKSLPKNKIFYFYILRCSDNTLYCGQTNNLEKRIKEHNSGSARCAKYTRGRRPVKLVYSEKYSTLKEAMQREWQAKHWPRKKKDALVTGYSQHDLGSLVDYGDKLNNVTG